MITAYSTALMGMNTASASLADRAGRLAQPPPEMTAMTGGDLSAATEAANQRDNELVNDLVGLGLDETAFKANLAVLRSAREMEERLLDMFT